VASRYIRLVTHETYVDYRFLSLFLSCSLLAAAQLFYDPLLFSSQPLIPIPHSQCFLPPYRFFSTSLSSCSNSSILSTLVLLYTCFITPFDHSSQPFTSLTPFPPLSPSPFIVSFALRFLHALIPPIPSTLIRLSNCSHSIILICKTPTMPALVLITCSGA